MADINSEARRALPRRLTRTTVQPGVGEGHVAPAGSLSEAHLLAYVELLFFAYRDFTSDPDTILRQLGFGRAHHRVLHFVNRYPGLRVAELLQILKITKQSLARVLRELIGAGYIEQRTGSADRRERRLFATTRGTSLAQQLSRPQIERIARTLAILGTTAASSSPHNGQDTARMFLYHMITPAERAAVDALMARHGPAFSA